MPSILTVLGVPVGVTVIVMVMLALAVTAVGMHQVLGEGLAGSIEHIVANAHIAIFAGSFLVQIGVFGDGPSSLQRAAVISFIAGFISYIALGTMVF